MQCSASPPTAPRTRRLPFDKLPGAHPAKGVDEVTTPARFSACPAIFSAPCGYDSTNSCSSRCIGTQNRYSSCYLLFLLSISTHRHHVGSPPVGRSPSRSTASAGGDAPQLVAGPVKDRHRSGAARAGGPHRMPARRPGSPYRQNNCSMRGMTLALQEQMIATVPWNHNGSQAIHAIGFTGHALSCSGIAQFPLGTGVPA